MTPLHVASHYDHVKVALLLLEKDASKYAATKVRRYIELQVRIKWHEEESSFYNSFINALAYWEFISFFLKNGFTPLHIASKRNQTDVAAILLERGVEPDTKTKVGIRLSWLRAEE